MDRLFLSAIFCALIISGCSSSDSETPASDGDNGSSSSSSSSSGGGTATINGLNLPSNMNFISAQSEASAAVGNSGRRSIQAYTDSNTDYSTDVSNAYVYDESMRALDTVNMIMCLMAQTKASDMVNQGAYIALVNEDKCEQGQNQSSSGETGQSAGGQVTEFNSWTIDSTRASNDSPQLVQIWVPGEEPEPGDMEGAMDAQTILVEVNVSESASDTDPYGSFVMNFKGVVDAGLLGGPAGTEVETMRGMLRTVANGSQQPQFEFVNVGGDLLLDNGMGYGFLEAVNVLLADSTGDTGQALTHTMDTHNEGSGPVTNDEKFAVAFDPSNLLRGKDTNGDSTIDAEQCLSRTSFDTNVWQYNLYHRDNGDFNGDAVTEGSRVQLNSGFPFNYDSDNDGTNDAYGWVGYHGVWAESGVLDDGSSITQFDYNSDSTTQLTVNVSPGKMVKRTASSELLSSFQGDEFQYWGQHPVLNMHGQWVVTIDTNNDFAITAHLVWGQNGPEISETVDHDDNPGTAEAAVAATLSFFDGEWFGIWSDALGGNIVYVHDAAIAANARTVTFYNEEFVTPADAIFANGAVTLYCYIDCLKGGLTQNDVNTANDRSALFYDYAGTAFQYTLAAASGKVSLIDVSNGQAVSAEALDLANIGQDWGINTGEMVTAQLANANEPWQVFEQTVSYRWETGQNDWNRLITVTNAAGQVQSFDPPLRFTYTHSTANDANADASYDGKKFMLEYNGPGNLHGFPWIEDTETRRWYAAITLNDSTQLTDGSNHFVVKAIEKEETMQEVAVGQCSALDISGLLANTNLELPTANDMGTVSFSLSEKPVVTDAPAVIEGEVQ